MAEDVNYASVVFKTKTQSPRTAKQEEETVYDEVKVKNQTTEQAADINVSAGFLPDKKVADRHHQYQLLACCLGILCVILLSGIIAVGVRLAIYNHESDVSELKEIKENQTILLATIRNLTDLQNKLISDNENLKRDQNNLTVQNDNLKQASTVLESKNKNLTAEIQQLETRNQVLETRNQELETRMNNLTEQMLNMQTTWNEQNVTRAQWSIDAYCPKKEGRQCKDCQHGWLPHQTNCYVIHDPVPAGQITWEEAHNDCKGKSSDLAVVVNEDEKTFLSENSWKSYKVKGYWIGLRVEDGRWKWIDGSNLTESSWLQQPATNGHCAISVHDNRWQSVNCGDKNRWICKRKALSV